MPFNNILGLDTPVGLLRRSLLSDQVGHAMLFFGPEGIGKRTTALAFAKALNCTDEQARLEGDFCDSCRSCRLISMGQHADVRLLTPETTGGKTVIPIDAMRTKIGENPTHPLPLREDVQFKPLEGRYKVYVIDPANRPGLQEEAGNALLLTLEEPPPYVVIILISSRPTAMLPTLVSRCLPVRFNLAPREAILNAVNALGTVSFEEASAIAGLADGRTGWALSVAANPQALNTRKELFNAIDQLYSIGRPAALRMAETMRRLASMEIKAENEEDDVKAKTGIDRIVRRNLPELLDFTASWWRDLLLTGLGQSDMRINVDYAQVFDRHSGRLSADRLSNGLHAVMNTKRMIERNVNIDLALERMWTKLLP